MSGFTYESGTVFNKLETFEWENIWWEHTEDTASKRVAYIGDSISCGTRGIANTISEGKIRFDGFGTSKALDNPYFQKSLLYFMNQQSKCDAILFNNGLHGWHLSESDYENEYRKMLNFIKSNSKAPIYIVLTTNIANSAETTKRIIERNEIAQKLANEFLLECIDLFSVSEKYSSLHSNDGVHFTNEGYSHLAECIVEKLNP